MLMNTITASFNTTVRQMMTEMSQSLKCLSKKLPKCLSEKWHRPEFVLLPACLLSSQRFAKIILHYGKFAICFSWIRRTGAEPTLKFWILQPCVLKLLAILLWFTREFFYQT